ncbi:MAG: hypothetical protein JNM63_12795 [Spirochaetia bacterium]|nr:hypothetical protein [Spirochaetia bacterium]
MKTILNGTILFLLLSSAGVSNPIERVLRIDKLEPIKDLRECVQGADAESFQIGTASPAGVNLKTLLGPEKKSFAEAMNAIGNPVLRMAEMSRYAWEGAEETDILRAQKDSADWWYAPEDFHRFCKEQGIQIIGFFDTYRWFDSVKKTHIDLRDPKTKLVSAISDAELASLVAANRKKINWVKKNGYTDRYVAWEIGNENYAPFRDVPEVYARIALALTKMAKEEIPESRTSVNIFVCAPNDENLTGNLANRRPTDISNTYDRWRVWTSLMLKGLGVEARGIHFASVHLYGTSLNYNANQKGLDTHARFVAAHPNAAHLRFLVTEWRFTAGDDLIGHRNFKMGALWNAKLTLTFLAHPQVDYTGAHELTTFSGLLYVNDGKVWRTQGTEKNKKPIVAIPAKAGSPAVEPGPFGPVMRMANDLVRKYPLLIEHKADLGENSSALFSSEVTGGKDDGSSGRDLEYLIAVSQKKDSLGGIAVNTLSTPIRVSLKGRFRIASARSLTCAEAMVFEPEIPGEAKAWSVKDLSPAEGWVTLAPLSVTYFEAKGL